MASKDSSQATTCRSASLRVRLLIIFRADLGSLPSMLDPAFSQIALVLLAAVVVGFLANLLKQPLIIAYIVVGILLGPGVLGLVSAGEEIALLAELGIALLLFLVGLKLDTSLIRSTGLVALATGVAQVGISLGIGILIMLAWGFSWLPALYVAMALAFSSTIIVVKVLSDRRELDQLHGQISIGVLIVQDVLVVVAMVAIASVASLDSTNGQQLLIETLVGSLVFLTVVAVIAKFLIPRLLAFLSRSPELMLVFGVGWAMSLAGVSHALGLSMEIGAFVAGVALASTPYRETLSVRMVSLRDVMILFFFIELGSTLSFSQAVAQIPLALLLSFFVLLAKPLIVILVMGALGYRSKVSMKVGVSLAQISEFSLILVALGFSLGQLDGEILSLVTLVAIITITLSTYLIKHSEKIYQAAAVVLRSFERSSVSSPTREDVQAHPFDVILIGAGRLGRSVIRGLKDKGARILVVDNDPSALKDFVGSKSESLFGDVGEPDFLASLPLNETDSVICTIHDRSLNLVLLETLHRFNFEGAICLTAMDEGTAKLLAENPRVTVIKPLKMAASKIMSSLPKLRQR